MSWSSAPSAVVVVPPYALGVVEGGVEVRLLEPLSDAGAHPRVLGLVEAIRGALRGSPYPTDPLAAPLAPLPPRLLWLPALLPQA